MRMRTLVSCLIAVMLALPLEGIAQTANNWKSVTSLQSGQKVIVELKDGKKLKRKFGHASETSVTLLSGKNTEDVARTDIRKVYRETGASKGKSTLVGAGVGGGAGAIFGAAALGSDDKGWFSITRSEAAGVVGIFGASVGAVTGFVVGLVRHKKTLIYEAS